MVINTVSPAGQDEPVIVSGSPLAPDATDRTIDGFACPGLAGLVGNIMSAAFFDRALQAHPEIVDEISAGEFGTLHGWLKQQIYQHGSKFTAAELIERVTGGPLTIKPYISYLNTKFGELYGL